MDLRNSNYRTFYSTTVWKIFSKIFIRSGKTHMKLNLGTSKSRKKKNPSKHLKILTHESPMQSYIKNRVKLWKQIKFES